MIKASDDEIREFFSTTIFEGIFSNEIKSTHADYFKGHIHSIKINGESNNVIGTFINVPVSANDIPKGECTFKCRVKEEVRISPSQIAFSLAPKTLRAKGTIDSKSQTKLINEGITNEDLFELWGVDDCECIGFYHYDSKSGGYLIDDLRKTNFDHIPHYLANNRAISLWLKFPQKNIEINNYYRFTWKLSRKDPNNPYEIYLDNRYFPQPIEPKWFIDKLFEDRHSDKSKNFGSAANFLDTLSKQLSARESTFVYELLQNANDYPVEGKMVDVEFHITDNYLLFLHSGDKFNVRNISGICGINEKEKVANRKAIGYKGIGFKTVFLNNHYVYLRTGDYSFRFDQGETPEKKRGGKIKRQDAPFQILPIWTEHNEISSEVNSVFDNVSEDFQVKIALRPDSRRILHFGKNSYENLFREVFSDSNIILFIPNINSVRVFINGLEECACYRKNEEWVIGDYESEDGEISVNLQKRINKTIEKGKSRIPEKYKDFEYTKVSFACKHEGAMIKAVDDANLYCYLPTSTSWGLPFLMNTDMIPKGDRNDIEEEVDLLELTEKEDEVVDDEEKNFNEELSSIAGSKLFMWIRDLLTSRKYHLGSVFALVPDFKKCKREHKDYTRFIEKFEQSFEECLETETIVPVPQGIALVNKVILDSTGLSTSGIMTDDEFRQFTGMEDYYLPLSMLRKDKNFISFLKRYAEDNQIFDVENLTDLIANEDFQEWLKIQDKNNKFLKFLLDKGYLADFLDKGIFLEEECGKLFEASELYFDVDKELQDLSDFSNNIYYLSLKTREFFKDDEAWLNVIKGSFAEFKHQDFVEKTLLSKTEKPNTITKLSKWETSYHFFKFLADYNVYCGEIADLPFFNDAEDAALVDSFKDKFIFFSSEDGHEICRSTWLSPVTFAFVSRNYTEKVLRYMRDYLDVRDFSNNIIATDIILHKDWLEKVNNAQKANLDSSVSFLLYCYANKDLFGEDTLDNYSLSTYDKDGQQDYLQGSVEKIYFPSSNYEYYTMKEWVGNLWMFVLDSTYIKGYTGEELIAIKSFINNGFGIKELSDKAFYVDIVKPNLKEIIKATSGAEDKNGDRNVDFIDYLDSNYQYIFEERKDTDKFTGIILVSDDGHDIPSNSSYVYTYDKELEDILSEGWIPSDKVYMTTRRYGNSRAILHVKPVRYSAPKFVEDVIMNEMSSINKQITSKVTSISFHNFVISHKEIIPDLHKKKMKEAKLYLYGNDNPSANSEGHKILSEKAKELFDLNLVGFKDLDIVDPAYNIDSNKDYWENVLGNTKFTVIDFLNWLNNNLSAFNSTITDTNKNVAFWRWLKTNNLAENTLKTLPALNVIEKNRAIIKTNTNIYLSNEYGKGAIEEIVTKYKPDSHFISPIYIKEGETLAQWCTFWTTIGVRYEIIDLLVDIINGGFAGTTDPEIPSLVAQHKDALAQIYQCSVPENSSTTGMKVLMGKLKSMPVKAKGGTYTLQNIIYVDSDRKEPFEYITIPNQATFADADTRRFIKEVIIYNGGSIIEKLPEWQNEKINRYIALQGMEDDSVLRSAHYQFINELAEINNEDRQALSEFEQLKKVQILNTDDVFVAPETLTLSSIYKPFCDFQKYNIEKLSYTSDSYDEKCPTYVGKLFSHVLKVHYNFRKDDAQYLSNRAFSIYFWTKYLVKRQELSTLASIKGYVEEKVFNNIACIPTKDYMKKPSELYSLSIASYVKKTDDWENKLPLSIIPNIEYDKDKTLFSLMDFKQELSLADCLSALIELKGKDTRQKLLTWVIKGFTSDKEPLIDKYRENEESKWTNSKSEREHISTLYALDSASSTLSGYFGGNARIIDSDYFPILDFRKACDILKIQTITDADLKPMPANERPDNGMVKHRLKIFALIIAGTEDPNTWKERYESYSDAIDSLQLQLCDKIDIQYVKDPTLRQDIKKFYHQDGNNTFYYVRDWEDKLVYTHFVEHFRKHLGMVADYDIVANKVMSNIDDAISYMEGYNALLTDEEFLTTLKELYPKLKLQLQGQVSEYIDELEEDVRPTYSADDIKDGVDNVVEEDDNTEPYDRDTTNVYVKEHGRTAPGTGSSTGSSESNVSNKPVPTDTSDDDNSSTNVIRQEGRSASNGTHSSTSQGNVSDRNTEQSSVSSVNTGASSPDTSSNTGRNVTPVDTEGTIFDDDFDDEYDYNYEGEGFDGYYDGSKDSEHRITNHGESGYEGTVTTTTHTDPTTTTHYSGERKPRTSGGEAKPSRPKPSYQDNRGWHPREGDNRRFEPWQISKEDVERFRPKGIPHTLAARPASDIELETINRHIDGHLTAEEVADRNYLAQLRLYQNLKDHNMHPIESEAEFVRNARTKNGHHLQNGKYIHKCSAMGGIMYISPSIWNMVQNERCIICVYRGAKQDEFQYFYSAQDLVNWVSQDDFIIKITGGDKVEILSDLYNSVLQGVKGTAYTMVRLISHERHDSLFAPISDDPTKVNQDVEDEF